MRRQFRIAIALGALALAAFAALAAQARSAAIPWTRVSGPTQPGVQLGLARTADGVLHVIWNRGSSPTSVFETRLSPAGKAIGRSTVATGFDGNGGLALLAMPDKSLRLFAAGAVRPGASAYGINTFTAAEAGGSWSLQGAFWGGAAANSASVIGATLTKDGQAVTAWRGFAGEGIPAGVPASPDVADQTASALATDAGTGSVVLSGVTIAGKGGVYAQQVLPSHGSAVVLPLPNGQNDWNPGSSGRIGAPGVYVAYADGVSWARLYRYGGGHEDARTRAVQERGHLCGSGRSALGFLGRQDDRAFRHALQPVRQRVRAGAEAGGSRRARRTGSVRPVRGLHRPARPLRRRPGRLRERLLAHARAREALGAGLWSRRRKATLSVRDAGDPVAGASLSVAGKRASTDAKGHVTLSLRRGSYSATATAPGYASVSARFTVR